MNIDIQYIYILSIFVALLLGAYGGVKFFVYKKGIVLTPQQEMLLEDVRDYAKEVVQILKKQLGDNQEIQIDNVVELVHAKFPGLSENIIRYIIKLLFEEIDKI
jgi:uncharacterized protein YneF (UPF0154 family)